ncbi:Bifunctional lysine-specific demethylase and histidyl-hydroxylase NO66 [Trichoplax sp. H2]|nr:Bifunctional lysine-specific demethylase and histidyl-hydroxylase NO66 [Trichoplax sp. H2]|eukprot:RDD46490.1 Bifunctional lysine-specific demethylase and histidyl-hydroxylase NO66 [Trichoplax sp. H2]
MHTLRGKMATKSKDRPTLKGKNISAFSIYANRDDDGSGDDGHHSNGSSSSSSIGGQRQQRKKKIIYVDNRQTCDEHRYSDNFIIPLLSKSIEHDNIKSKGKHVSKKGTLKHDGNTNKRIAENSENESNEDLVNNLDDAMTSAASKASCNEENSYIVSDTSVKETHLSPHSTSSTNRSYTKKRQTAKRSTKNLRKRKLKILANDKAKLENDLDKTVKISDNGESQIKLKRRKFEKLEEDSLIKLLNDDRKIDDSFEVAKQLFQWMILPIPLDTFFNLSWERKPILAQRRSSSYNNGLFSSHDLDRIVRENYIEYSVNLDVTTYENGVRETHNAEGRVLASVMWDYYQNGCSIRMLNPQTYSESLWKFCSLLQEYFGSFVGCNMYLTPPGTQGFAPHFDDIEAFVLQLEGKKKWRFYNPRDDSEILPEYSSGMFELILLTNEAILVLSKITV